MGKRSNELKITFQGFGSFWVGLQVVLNREITEVTEEISVLEFLR